MSILSNCSDEEFERIVKQSYSYLECLKNLGYNSYSGSTVTLIKQRIQKLQIDISHFGITSPQKRTKENVFIVNSTASQKTLRQWYEKGNYTEYKCSICGQEPFWNGKELIMILDHINGCNNDDRLENLRWVCPNCNYQLDTTNGKNKKHKEHQIKHCVDCGKIISKNATRCISCERKKRAEAAPTEVKQLTREQLKTMIRTIPFTKIGEKFGVSDNAVRKWCDKYNLPRKASDIKRYSDEDWEKL